MKMLVRITVVMATMLAGSSYAAAAQATPPGGRAAHVLFVSPQGRDDATGTRRHPLRTPQVAVDRLSGGGTVRLLPGTYARQRIVVQQRHRLRIIGRHAVLDARGLVPLDGDSGVVQVEDSSHVTVRGLDIRGYRTTSTDKVPIGIYVTGHDAGVTLAHNHVHLLGNDNQTLGSFDINAHGIAVYGRDPSSPITGLRITGNEVDHLHLGASEAVVVNGNVDGWAITRNRIHHVDNIGIDAIGYEETLPPAYRYTTANRARHGLIAHNTVTGVVSKGNPAYWEDGEWCNCADGIYVDGAAQIAIQHNTVRRADIGIEVGAENGRGHTDHVRVVHNRVRRSAYVGLALGGYDPQRGEVYDVTVADNDFRNDNTLDDGSPELLLQYKLHQLRVTGNRVTATHRAAPLVLQRVERVGTAAQNAGVRVDHNDYGGPVGAPRAQFIWLGREITGFTTYRRVSHQDVGSTWTRR
jgi:hypothetical protein